MSGLNLVPNPTVLAVQAGVFMANIFVIKKLWLDPYLRVYEKRQANTTGSQTDAEKISKENGAKKIDNAHLLAISQCEVIKLTFTDNK